MASLAPRQRKSPARYDPGDATYWPTQAERAQRSKEAAERRSEATAKLPEALGALGLERHVLEHREVSRDA